MSKTSFERFFRRNYTANRALNASLLAAFAVLLIVCIGGRASQAADNQKPAKHRAAQTPKFDYRKWVSAGGKYSTRAELVEFSDGTVRLRKRDGKIAALAVERLCEEDQKFIESLAGGGNILIGRVVDVSDGNTVVVGVGKEKHTVLLSGIDSPPQEDKNAAKQAKTALSRMVLRKKVQVKWSKRDESKRIVGDVYLADRCVNEELAGKDAPAAARPDAETEKTRNQPRAQPVAESEKTGNPAENDPMVYITRSGKKYHREGCRFLKKSKTPMPLSRARQTHSPCSSCNPPQ